MRRDKYKTHVLPRLHSIESWVLEGYDENQIARKLGICSRTLEKYKKEHNELDTILKSGRDEILAKVENALLKKAMGYVYKEVRTVEKGNGPEVTTTEKEMSPDLSAISFLLKNYCPEKWCDKPTAEKEKSSSGGVVILPEILEEDEE